MNNLDDLINANKANELKKALSVAVSALENTIYDAERLKHGEYAVDEVSSALTKITEILSAAEG